MDLPKEPLKQSPKQPLKQLPKQPPKHWPKLVAMLTANPTKHSEINL